MIIMIVITVLPAQVEAIRDQRYRTNPDAGLRQMTTGKNADAGQTFSPIFRHILMIFQHNIKYNTGSGRVLTFWVYPFPSPSVWTFVQQDPKVHTL
jgi:hypothetical protein